MSERIGINIREMMGITMSEMTGISKRYMMGITMSEKGIT